ncbi:TPA: response regulator transcription factor [Candidatus Scatousia excrementigallinarum]|uniref:Response regulator transcription factor n=1 Tax=Candidatus Scatousia excrementigallinarum TaxID=2840935 RepID=A0A9D1F061_9BACT|nr:response regulator transcription factor [Candidatus Scatousia excrementigallinarum]
MASTKTNINELCEREIEVLNLLTYGYENKQISQKLYVSTHTVKACISGILKKLKAKNRTQAVSIAFRKHIIK